MPRFVRTDRRYPLTPILYPSSCMPFTSRAHLRAADPSLRRNPTACIPPCTGKFKSTNSVQQFHCNEKNRRRGSAVRQIRRRLNIKWDMTGALFLFRSFTLAIPIPSFPPLSPSFSLSNSFSLSFPLYDACRHVWMRNCALARLKALCAFFSSLTRRITENRYWIGLDTAGRREDETKREDKVLSCRL